MNELQQLHRLDLNLLRVFAVLMETRHVGRAAARLHLTPSAVSHALRRLREQVGDELFLRTPRGLRPTPRAEAAAEEVADVLARLGAVLRPTAFDPAAERRTVRLGTTDYTSFVLAPRLVASLRDEAPGVDLRLMTVDRLTMLPLVERGELDAAVGLWPGELPEGLARLPLFAERTVCVARPDHPALAGGGDLDLATFARLPHLLVSFTGDAAGPVDELLAERGLSRRVAVTVPHVLAAPFVVAASDLLAVLAERVALALRPLAPLALYPLPVAPPAWRIDLFLRRRRLADPFEAWLAERLRAVAAEV